MKLENAGYLIIKQKIIWISKRLKITLFKKSVKFNSFAFLAVHVQTNNKEIVSKKIN